MKDFLAVIEKIPLKVIDTTISYSDYVQVSISSSNQDLSTINVSSSKSWEGYMASYLKKNNAKVAFGGYLEKRDIYKRSAYFNSSDEDRNIHLGVDLWCESNTKVLAVLDGEIHSYANNSNHGDYGPTIILKHEYEGKVFYSLYGHLSLVSIKSISVGQKVKKEEVIGFLGEANVNGDYAPHLHFQLILDIENYKGDYPGVSSEKTLEFYKKNCPNPNLLLKLPHEI